MFFWLFDIRPFFTVVVFSPVSPYSSSIGHMTWISESLPNLHVSFNREVKTCLISISACLSMSVVTLAHLFFQRITGVKENHLQWNSFQYFMLYLHKRKWWQFKKQLLCSYWGYWTFIGVLFTRREMGKLKQIKTIFPFIIYIHLWGLHRLHLKQ